MQTILYLGPVLLASTLVHVENFNDLFHALDQVNWFPDNELIRWMNRKGVTTILADEITRICGASIDIQEGSGARSHPKFYAGRETLDLLCPNAECGVEIVGHFWMQFNTAGT